MHRRRALEPVRGVRLHNLRHVDRRDEHGGLVLEALALDLLLERALQRLDRLGHLVAADLEDTDHLDVAVRLERGAHELAQVDRVVHRVAVVLARGDRLQLREDALRVFVGDLERLGGEQKTAWGGGVDRALERGGLDCGGL